MRVKRWLSLAVVLPLLLAMRDPFQPVVDRCRIAQLTQWRYQGVVSSQMRQIGILRDAAGSWHRVKPKTILSGGWQVMRLTEQELLIATGGGCEPANWRWLREGVKDEAMESVAADNIGATDPPVGKESSRVADGG